MAEKEYASRSMCPLMSSSRAAGLVVWQEVIDELFFYSVSVDETNLLESEQVSVAGHSLAKTVFKTGDEN